MVFDSFVGLVWDIDSEYMDWFVVGCVGFIAIYRFYLFEIKYKCLTDVIQWVQEVKVWFGILCTVFLCLVLNILAYFMQIDMSMIYLAGILGILYWYLSSDLSKKKKRKKVSFSLAMMWLWLFAFECCCDLSVVFYVDVDQSLYFQAIKKYGSFLYI